MTDHKVTAQASAEVVLRGPHEWEIIDCRPQTWECTCGAEFANARSAWEHREEET